MPEHPQPPVPWEELKRLQDESAPRRLGCRHLAGLLLLGLSCMALLVAGVAALEPSESVEPARYLFYTLLILAFLSGWGGGSLLKGTARSNDDKP